jgi:hypothetical protein
VISENSSYHRESFKITRPSPGDIFPAERVRDAWESWTTDRRRAAIRAVLHRVVINPLPPPRGMQPGKQHQGPAVRREREVAILQQHVEFDWRI